LEETAMMDDEDEREIERIYQRAESEVPSIERKAMYRLERGGHTKGKLLVAPVSYALGQSYRRVSQTPPMN
jgi:hypothetical protein